MPASPVTTATASKPSPDKAEPRCPARERLLDAAAVVFARDGLAGSTTREIARAAGVNEVTLFRLFQNKQKLLTAVLEQVFSPATPAERMTPPAVETDLSEIVREHAESYAASIGKNPMLMRVVIGEIQHFHEHELAVIRGVFKPRRQRFIDRLRAAQAVGLARKDVDPAVVADQINSIVFMGVLRNTLPYPREYSARDYINGCVETFVRAIEIPAHGPARKVRKQ
jgi:AcrR family transcriptional regulator